MSTVYSAELLLAHAVSSLDITVPPGQRWVIRTITVFWPGGVGLQDVQLIDDGSSATLFKASANAISGYVWDYWNDLRIVVPEGRSFSIVADGSPDIGLYGYAFVLP